MTISSTDSRKSYAGNGVTTSFGTSPVVFFDSADLKVYVVVTATGAATLLTENTHYTVTGGSGSTGTIDTSAGSSPYGAPSALQTLLIVRDVAATQGTDFVNNDSSDAEASERTLDKLTVLAQQLNTRLDRALALPESDVSGATVEVPALAVRADRFLAFDADGNLTSVDGSDGTAGSLALALASTSSTTLGDYLVGVKRTATGAVAETLHGWIENQVLNAKDFGAAGDGVTDDTAALAAWISACAGKAGYAPSGTYLTTAEIAYNVATSGSIMIFGDGPTTIFKASGTSNKVLHISGTAGVTTDPVSLRSFAIQSGTSGTCSAGLHLDGIAHWFVQDVWVDGKSKMTNGIQCTAAQQGQVAGGGIINCVTGGLLEQSGGVHSNGIDWHGMTFVNSTTNMKVATNGADDLFFNSNHLTSASQQIDLDGGGIGIIVIRDNHLEGAAVARDGLIVRSGKVLVSGNTFVGTAGTKDIQLTSASTADCKIIANLIDADVTIGAGVTDTIFALNSTGGTCTNSGTSSNIFANHAFSGSGMPETLTIGGSGIVGFSTSGRLLCAGATDDTTSGLQVGNGLVKLTSGNADIISSGNLYLDAASSSAINLRISGSAASAVITSALLTLGSGVKLAVTNGGSTTISTGVGSVKMSTANAATNTAWIPINYAGSTYFIPAWTTNSP